jgi:hypothetical protein
MNVSTSNWLRIHWLRTSRSSKRKAGVPGARERRRPEVIAWDGVNFMVLIRLGRIWPDLAGLLLKIWLIY